MKIQSIIHTKFKIKFLNLENYEVSSLKLAHTQFSEIMQDYKSIHKQKLVNLHKKIRNKPVIQ